jgi:myo-inositol-1(or 4)-monophosphatase
MLPQDFIDLAIALADAAGAVIRPYFRAPLTVEVKPDRSPVTQADRAAEQAMRALITRTHPSHGIHGEEFGLERADAPYRWVLDPIDGTRAFTTGRPLFGTLIALLHHETPVLGMIDQPISGERWLGITGRATQFRGGAGTTGTRPCATLAEAELSATSPEMMGSHLARFQNLAGAARRVTWGGDCYAYGLLALGQIDIIAERDLKIWDWAALLPVVEGAGGRMTDWSGRPLTLEGDGSVLAVGDSRLLQETIKKLEGEK